MPQESVSVQGPNFDTPLSLQDFIKSYERIGFQANSLGKAIEIVNRMVSIHFQKTLKSSHSTFSIYHSVNGGFLMSQ